MNSSPPNQRSTGPPERNLAHPLLHQQYAQQTRGGQPAQSFVTGPGFPSAFATVLPPNMAAMPQMLQQPFPGQQSSPHQNMFGPSQSHLPEEQALRQVQFARVIQQQPLQPQHRQHHHQQHQQHLSPISQQHYPQTNSQYQSQLPNFGQRAAFVAFPPVHLGLQQPATSPSQNRQNGLSNQAPHLSQFALQTFRDMHEQSPADFIRGIRRPHPTSHPQTFRPQPRPPVGFAPQQSSGIFPLQSPSVMAGSRRKRPSRDTNPIPSSAGKPKNNTSARGISDGTASQSMTTNESKDGTKIEHSPKMNASSLTQRQIDGKSSQAMMQSPSGDTVESGEYSPERNPSPLAHIRRRLAGRSVSGQGNQKGNLASLLGDSSSNGATHALQPRAAISPQDETMTGMNEDSGYASRHEPLGKDVPAPDSTAEILDAAATSLEQQIQSTTAGLPAHHFSPFDIEHSVPFMKVTTSIDPSQPALADNVSSLAGFPPFLFGEDRPGRPEYISHPHNRRIKWQHWEQIFSQKLNPYEPYILSGGLFTDPLGVFNDNATIMKLPNGGLPTQYLSNPQQPPNPAVWVKQAIELPQNGDLWLPAPLHQLFMHFEIPYGIAILYPESAKTSRPDRRVEFTESEAKTLKDISMERLRAGLFLQPQLGWEVYTARFMAEHGWTPTDHRMAVVDLMFKVDMVYYWQGTGGPLHEFSIGVQNDVRKWGGLSPVAGYD